jgi:hypothetical protein
MNQILAVRLLAFIVGTTFLDSGNTVAQQFTLTDFGLRDNGGGISSAGVYSVEGIITTATDEQLRGGSYSIQGAIAQILLVVEIPSAPALRIQVTARSVLISWSAPSGVFELQQTTSVSDPASWKPLRASPTLTGTEFRVTIPISSGNSFLRLKSRQP